MKIKIFPLVINIKIHIKNNIKISKSAVIQKRASNANILFKLNDRLISYIYRDNKLRIIAVDGSQINLPKELHKSGFKLSDNKGYSVGHISGLYNIKKNIPINYNLVTHSNERKALIEQLIHVKKGDILVLDRGYFSTELVDILEKKRINYVFRIKQSLSIVDELESLKKKYIETHISHNKKNINVKLFKYDVKEYDKENKRKINDMYYVMTNIKNIDQCEYIRNIYKDTWLQITKNENKNKKR